MTGLDGGEEQALNDENAGAFAKGLTHDDEPLPNGDDALGDFDPGTFGEHIEESIEQDDSYIEGEQSALIDPEPFDEPVEETAPESSKKGGGPGRTAPVAQMVNPDASQLSASAPTTGRKGRGGRPKQARTEVYEDPETDSAAKPSKRRSKAAGKKAPKERDPNARPKPATNPTSKEIPIREGSAGPRGGTYLVQRSETPATDNGATITRSGRASYKPLASWRGEKVIFGQRPDWETPASVTDIIRTDEIQLPPQPRRKAIRKARAPSELEEIEEEPEDLEPWETESGIMHAQVMRWDQEAGKYDENEAEEAGTCFPSLT